MSSSSPGHWSRRAPGGHGEWCSRGGGAAQAVRFRPGGLGRHPAGEQRRPRPQSRTGQPAARPRPHHLRLPPHLPPRARRGGGRTTSPDPFGRPRSWRGPRSCCTAGAPIRVQACPVTGTWSWTTWPTAPGVTPEDHSRLAAPRTWTPLGGSPPPRRPGRPAPSVRRAPGAEARPTPAPSRCTEAMPYPVAASANWLVSKSWLMCPPSSDQWRPESSAAEWASPSAQTSMSSSWCSMVLRPPSRVENLR